MEQNPKLKQAFGHVLLKLREEKNASQKEVADYCGLERAYISRLERALLQPSLNTIFRIAEFFEIPPSELISLVQASYKKRKI